MIAEKDLCPCCRCRPIAPDRSVCDRCAGGDNVQLMQKMDKELETAKIALDKMRWECPSCGFTMHAQHAESPVTMPDGDECPVCQKTIQDAELEMAADKLSDVWLLLDDIARSQRDSDQTRQLAAAVLMKQQCPGWKPKDLEHCSLALWNDRKPSPRTCEVCAMGPCAFGLKRKVYPV